MSRIYHSRAANIILMLPPYLLVGFLCCPCEYCMLMCVYVHGWVHVCVCVCVKKPKQVSLINGNQMIAIVFVCTVRTPVFGRHQFFGTSEHYGKAHGSLLSGWMNYNNYTACCWFPTSNNILILPSQFWQISFESYWLHYSKCWILVLLRYWNFCHSMFP